MMSEPGGGDGGVVRVGPTRTKDVGRGVVEHTDPSRWRPVEVERVHARADGNAWRRTLTIAVTAIARTLAIELVDCLGELVVEIADGR